MSDKDIDRALDFWGGLPKDIKKDIFFYYVWKYALERHRNRFLITVLDIQRATKYIKITIDKHFHCGTKDNIDNYVYKNEDGVWLLLDEYTKLNNNNSLALKEDEDIILCKKQIVYLMEVKPVYMYHCEDCNMYFYMDEALYTSHRYMCQIPMVRYLFIGCSNNNTEKLAFRHSVDGLLVLMKNNGLHNTLEDELNMNVIIKTKSIGNKRTNLNVKTFTINDDSGEEYDIDIDPDYADTYINDGQEIFSGSENSFDYPDDDAIEYEDIKDL